MADNQQLIESIAKIAEHVQAVAPKRKVSHHEYMQARKKRHDLKRQIFMSGARIRPKQLSDDQIVLLNKLQAGKYAGGRVVVLERDAAGLVGGAIDILVRNKTREDRMQSMADFPDLDTLLKKILAEQEQQGKRK